MSDNADIVARTQRFREAVRAFTPPTPQRHAKLLPMKDSIIELREKGASLRLMRELLLTVGVAVSIDTIARFLAEMNGEQTRADRIRRPRNRVGVPRRTKAANNPSLATSDEPSSSTQPIAPLPEADPTFDRKRTRGPRVADPRNL